MKVEARVIEKVEDHPNADRLTLNWVNGDCVISNRKEDGSARYSAGDVVAFVPEGALLPDQLMKDYGYWDPERDCGFLDGPGHNRVKSRKLRGIETKGLVLPVPDITVGEDLTERLGITWET